MRRVGISLAMVMVSVSVLAGAGMAREGVGWTYHGETGPQAWGNLKPEFVMCRAGRNQSPIDIAGTVSAKLDPIVFDYKAGTESVLNNGHTIKVNMAPGSTMKIDGKTFKLLQFHFHSPSEHTVNGKSFPLAMHLVHMDDDGNLAAVGVLFEEGAENPVLARLWKDMPAKAGEKKKPAEKVDPLELLPKQQTYYRYSGSLTTPPCTEGVRWLVMIVPMQASKAQIGAFRAAMGDKDTNRPVLPLNARLPIKGQ